MLSELDYIEWNHPFTGYEYNEHLQLELQKEYDNAIHDQWKARLQEGTILGTQEETQKGEGSCNEEQSPVYGC